MSELPSRRRLRNGSVLARSLVLAGTLAAPVYGHAADLTISNSRTDTVSTSDADGGPGDITVNANGRVNVSSGAAIIVDSSNDVTNGGTLESSAGTDTRGIMIAPGAFTSTITNNGSISLSQDSDSTTVDQGNYGIYVEPGASLTGDIVNGTAGTITAQGKDSVGIYTLGSVSGKVTNGGSITADGSNGMGMVILGNVGGTVSNTGTIKTGSASVTTYDNKGNPTTIAEVNGGTGLAIGGSVAGGVLNDGDGLTTQETTDLSNGTVDTVRGKTKDNIGTDASITVTGGANALKIGPDANGASGGDITIGVLPEDGNIYGVVNRGELSSKSQTDNLDVETVRIGLDAAPPVASSTTVEGGFLNDGGDITATAQKANATAVTIGSLASVPEINNTGNIAATTDTQLATGISIQVGATVPTITNSGIISATGTDSGARAVGIIDLSGTLQSIVNSGQINTSASSTRAIDLSASTIDSTIDNTGSITGDVVLGSGNDAVTITGGSLTGNLEMGAGNNTLGLVDQAKFDGSLTASNGQVDLAVTNSSFAISNSTGAHVHDASFDATSTLVVPIYGSDATAGSLVASGTASFASGATLITDFKTLASTDVTFTLVDAGTLSLENGLDGLNVSDTSAFFNVDVALDPTNSNKIIVTVHRASAEELGLTSNQTAVFNASPDVLQADQQVGAAFANLATKEQVQDAFNQLMPDNSGATQIGIFKTQAAIFSAINKRMDSIYKLDRRYKERVQRIAGKDPERAKKMDRRHAPTIWAEQLVYVANQNPYGQQLGYGGYSYGIAMGADYPLFGLDAFGFSISQVWSEYREKGSFDKPLATQTTQLNLYAGIETGGFFVDVTGGYGFSSYDQERRLVIGDVDRSMFSNWGGHHMNANVRVGYTATLGRFTLTGMAAMSYMKLHENGYTERGIADAKATDTTADGVRLAVEGQTVEFLRGNLGFQLGMQIRDGAGVIEPQIRGGLTHEFRYKGPVNVAYFLAGGPSTAFTTLGELGAATTYYAGVGIDVTSYFGTLSFDYDAEMGSGKLNHVVSGTVRVSF
ncbi:MAG: autotransporter domain-containing protein [Alphaproteobacteria bacterium]|nr:autotransporter domain-containing protein [Alphaproteobacteria bacterium]